MVQQGQINVQQGLTMAGTVACMHHCNNCTSASPIMLSHQCFFQYTYVIPRPAWTACVGCPAAFATLTSINRQPCYSCIETLLFLLCGRVASPQSRHRAIGLQECLPLILVAFSVEALALYMSSSCLDCGDATLPHCCKPVDGITVAAGSA